MVNDQIERYCIKKLIGRKIFAFKSTSFDYCLSVAYNKIYPFYDIRVNKPHLVALFLILALGSMLKV